MKKHTQNTTLKSLVTAVAALGLISVPAVKADDDRTAVKVRDANPIPREDPVKADDDRTAVKVDRVPLKADVNATFVDGYTIPNQYQTYFTEVPAIEGENVIVRYHGGRAYYVNNDDWKIVRIVDLDSSIKVAEEDSAFIKGYVIPEDRRTRFVEVPNPDAKISVRYYNNNAYYMDSSFRIVRIVRLSR